MGYLFYEDLKKLVYKGLVFLAVVILIEVFFLFLGKGYVIGGLEDISWLGYVVGFVFIVLLFYKVYYIIYEFMYMWYEVKGFVLSVFLFIVLLVWVLIVFF